MSDSVWPHRRQPTRLLHPWESPGKNTGVGCHFLLQCMKVKSESEVAQSCLTLCDPIDGSPPGSPVPGILQARTLEWVAISFSKAWKWKMKVKLLSRVWLLATPWTAAYQGSSVHGIFQAGVLEYKVYFQAIWYISIKSSILSMLFSYFLSFLFIVFILLNACHRLR